MRNMGAWNVYVVRCADGSLYTGIAMDVVRRVAEHNTNDVLAARYTRSRRPVQLVYEEPCENRSAAAKREYEIKQLNKQAKEWLVTEPRQPCPATPADLGRLTGQPTPEAK
jgi:putative endonuclease